MGRNYTQTSRESILGSRRTKGKNKDKHFVESLGLIYVQVYYTWLLLHGLYLIVIGVVSNAVGYPTTRYTTSHINVVTDPVAYRTTRYTTSHINVVTDPVAYPTTRYTTSHINVVTDPVEYPTTRYTTSHINLVSSPIGWYSFRLLGVACGFPVRSIWHRVWSCIRYIYHCS